MGKLRSSPAGFLRVRIGKVIYTPESLNVLNTKNGRFGSDDFPLQMGEGTDISHLGKRKIIDSKVPLRGDV